MEGELKDMGVPPELAKEGLVRGVDAAGVDGVACFLDGVEVDVDTAGFGGVPDALVGVALSLSLCVVVDGALIECLGCDLLVLS